MSHNLGPVRPVNRVIGPDSGNPATSGNVWLDDSLSPSVSVPAHGSVKFVILHFTNAIFPSGNRLEVALGNGQIDEFDGSSGMDFFTRPVKVTDGQNVEVRYITDGNSSGGVTLLEYGQAEEYDSGGDLSKVNPDAFLHENPYREPRFETRGGGTRWDNVACLSPATNPLIQAAKSVGIIFMVHDGHVSSCSGTLIQPDLFLLSGHCADSASNIEARSGSVCFSFATNCDNSKPTSYEPLFFKVTERVVVEVDGSGSAQDGDYDYALLRLSGNPTAHGIPPATIRLDLPAIGEPAFAIHHPNGTVKKITSASVNPRITEVTPLSQILRLENIDLKGGSSGSGLFDANGQLIGLNNWVGGANSINGILRRIANPPDISIPRDVMIVMDRSGSMDDVGLSGELKIEEAKDAGSLFVQLIRNNQGDKIGMVSFSTSASNPIDFTLKDVTPPNKMNLVGSPPDYSGGSIGGLTAGGATSIGDGVRAALTQFDNSRTSDKAILLLTDGLQNRDPLIQNIETQIGNTRLCIIGYGTDANLDGSLLTRLAWDYNGSYAVARNKMELSKFFAICFGEIFADGAVVDPFHTLPAGSEMADPVTINICEEQSITVVLGWDKPHNNLSLQLISPNGKTLLPDAPNVVSDSGKTWAFMRIQLPFETERAGQWKIEVFRPQGSVIEFATHNTNRSIKYFLNVVAQGGAKLKNLSSRKRVYTGDDIFPKLRLQYPNNTIPANIKMELTLTRPGQSLGNLVVKEGLKTSTIIAGDAIPARYKTLKDIETQNGGTLVSFTEQEFELLNIFEEGKTLEPSGIYGKILTNITQKEGHYTFKVNAAYGQGCLSSREANWAIYVSVGIDPDNTDVKTQIIETLPGGKQRVTISFTPKDKYGNYLGPGKLGELTVFPAAGNELTGDISDLENGTYVQEVIKEADPTTIPGITIVQDERPPILICPGSSISTTIPIFYFWLLLAILIILIILFFVFYS